MNDNRTVVSLHRLSKLREAVRKMKRFSWSVRINYLKHTSGIYVWDTKEEILKRVIDSSAIFREFKDYDRIGAILRETNR